MKTEKELQKIEEEVVEVICEIYDTEIPVNIYALGLIYDVQVSEDCDVNITMTLTSPNCPVAESLPKEVEDKLVYLMSVDKARFRNPIVPNCKLFLEIKAIRSRGRVWRYQGIAKVNEKKMADAEWSATVVDRNK